MFTQFFTFVTFFQTYKDISLQHSYISISFSLVHSISIDRLYSYLYSYKISNIKECCIIIQVCIADVSAEAGSAAVTDLTSSHSSDHVTFIQCDVSAKHSLTTAFEHTISTFCKIDIVFNNAGIADEDNWEKMIQINIGSKFLSFIRSCTT